MHRFLETKDHLINRLDLTDEQKTQLKDFFKKYPSHENKIDWNRKDLKWEDFANILANEGKSRSQAKKYGISGLTLNKDYNIVFQNDECTIYYPLTFLASETLASPKVAPLGVTGEWCIAGGNYDDGTHDKYWRDYTGRRIDFFFIFTKETKYAIARYPELVADSEVKFECFDCGDHLINLYSIEIPRVDMFDIEMMMIKYPHYLEDLQIEKTPDGFVLHKDDKGVAIIAYKGRSKEVRLPEKATKLSSEVFNHNTEIEKVVIPSTLEEIEEYSFASCSFLGTVVFEPHSKIKWIPNECFYSCTSLQEINLPESLISINARAFCYCTHLSKITIPDMVGAIGPFAFCHTAIDTITLPENILGLSHCCFQESSLRSIVLPKEMADIHHSAFFRCVKLEQVTLPKDLNKIAPHVFEGCINLKKIIYPGTLKELINVDGVSELTGFSNISLQASDKTLVIEDGSFKIIHTPS